jgi:hypothetical protein
MARKQQYTCSEIALSLALFNDRGTILYRFKNARVRPGEFGLQNINDARFQEIIPELRRCTMTMNSIGIRPGDVLQVVPDSNVEKNVYHSIYIVNIHPGEVVYDDDNGTFILPRKILLTWWKRAGKMRVRCS